MGSGLEYGTAYYTVFVFESSGSAKYAVVQVPLRFRFDREVLVFSQAAMLPDVEAGGGKENKRASGRAETALPRIMRSCHHSDEAHRHMNVTERGVVGEEQGGGEGVGKGEGKDEQ